jgi:hypothetical protein
MTNEPRPMASHSVTSMTRPEPPFCSAAFACRSAVSAAPNKLCSGGFTAVCRRSSAS